MNKFDYMNELEQKLSVFGDDIKNEIVSDYEEHFRMGLANGKTEEQICTELGSVDELVDELNKLTGMADGGANGQAGATGADAGINYEEARKVINEASEKFAKGMSDALNNLAAMLGSAAANIVKGSSKMASEFADRAGTAADKATTKAGKFADKASSRAGEMADKAAEKISATVNKENMKAFAEKATAVAGELAGKAEDAINGMVDRAKAKMAENGVVDAFDVTFTDVDEEAGSNDNVNPTDCCCCGASEAAENTTEKAAENVTETCCCDASEAAENAAENAAETCCCDASEVAENATENATETCCGASEATEDLTEDPADGPSNWTRFAEMSAEYAKKFANGVGTVAGEIATKTTAFAKTVSENYRETMNKEAGEAAASTDCNISSENGSSDSTNVGRVCTNGLLDEFDEDEDEDVYVRTGTSTGECDSVVIDTDCADVMLCDSEDNLVHFTYRNEGTPNQQLAYGFDVRQDGKTLYMIAKKRPGTSNFFKSMSCPDIELTVYVPDSLKNISVHELSGDIEAEDVSAEQVTLSSMSGDIALQNCMTKALEVSTMSGDVSAEDTSAMTAQIKTISGDIKCTAGNAKTLNASSTSGDIEIEEVEAPDMVLNSVSGDLDVRLDGVDGFLAHVKTTSGDVSLEYNDESIEIIRSGSYVMGGGAVKLNLTTVSGDIDVTA